MRLNTRKSRFNIFFVAVALLLPLGAARAQAIKEQAAVISNQKSEKQTESKREEKSEAIEELKSKMDQLQSLIEQQQRALELLQKRLDESEGAVRTAALVSSKPEAAKSEAAKPETAKSDASLEPRAASLEINSASSNAPAATRASAGKPAVQDKPLLVAGWDKNHAFLRSADGRFETFFTGYGQFDLRGYQSGIHPPNTYLIRRARLAFEGRLERYFDFKIEADFADTVSTLLRDFYINIHRIDEFQFRFGQFKEPYSQEEIRPDIYQDFVERSLVNNLAPSRSPGLMISGSISKGKFEYQVGSFTGKGLLGLNNNGTPENAIRLRFNPWKSGSNFLSKGLIFGGAFAQGKSLGGTSVRGLTESRSISYFTPDTVNGKIIRANGELTWLLGPATIRAEYDQTNQDRDNLGLGGRNLPGVVAKGFMAQATYMLTGENKPDAGGIAPKHNLFGDESGAPGFGAWELKFRYSDLQIADGTAKSNRAQTIYFGPNWYMNRFVKYLLDVGFERFNDPFRSPNPADRNYFVILSRIQVAF
jgi:phosphate-selective porin OprO and OprP